MVQNHMLFKLSNSSLHYANKWSYFLLIILPIEQFKLDTTNQNIVWMEQDKFGQAEKLTNNCAHA